MYLDAHRYKIVSRHGKCSLVNGIFTVFLRNIHSDERFIGTPPKEVLYILYITK